MSKNKHKSSIDEGVPENNYFRFFYFTFIGLLILFLVIVIKAKTAPDFEIHPILFAFTILITTFQLSRLGAAMFFDLSHRLHQKKHQHINYEPFVSFVVPCKNEEKDIRNTIEKCYEIHYPNEKFEVIVINDGSTDNTIGVLNSMKGNYPDLTIVDWKINKGKRHGMAEGFRLAKGEIVVQLDSDSFIEPSTFRELIEPFKNPKVGAVCAHADPANADKNVITKMQAAYYYMSFRILKAAESVFEWVFCCSGCSSAYRKSVVMPVMDQWLKEKFLGDEVNYGDDRALTSWVLKQGFKTVYTDRVKAYTIVPENFKQLMKQQLRWKKSWIINGIFTSRFIFTKDPFIGVFYFLPLLVISFITPFIVLSGLVIFPLVNSVWPIYYLIGIFLVTTLFLLYYRYTSPNNKYWAYLYLWQILSIFVLSFVMFYAAIKIKDRGWGTR